MCRMKPRHLAHIRGSWRGSVPRDTEWACWGYASPEPTTKIINMPVFFNNVQGNPKFVQKMLEAEDEVPTPLLPVKGRLRICLITKLPMEILLQIAEYLLPTDVSFHIFPSTRDRYGGPRKKIVHKFSAEAPNEQDRVKAGRMSAPRQYLTALAQACRVLSEAYYEVMYGMNHFILEVSATSVYPSIEGPKSMGVESWTKLVHGKLQQPTWPFTERSIQHVRDLTLLGTVPLKEKEGTKKPWGQQLFKVVQLLKHAAHLNRLTIDLRKEMDLAPWSTKAPAPSPPPPPFNLNKRLGWGVDGPHDSVLRLRTVINSDEHSSMVEFWDMFNTLRGVREVVLSGHIKEDLAKDLSTNMMSQAVTLDSVEGSRKTQKSGAKRKRMTESHSSIKYRRRARV